MFPEPQGVNFQESLTPVSSLRHPRGDKRGRGGDQVRPGFVRCSSTPASSPAHEADRETEDRAHEQNNSQQHGCDDRDLGDARGQERIYRRRVARR